ncbi:MW1434 family type I TA system toxin [Cytobacillus horneckiae]|uniref:Thoeris anti-defense Tad2 family protein n=1 Tax=Cytobacillus horneckiae TaxID=549687 RepID=UPI0039A23270
MNVQEAIILAKKEGRGITRESWGARSPLIIPSNTIAGMVVVDYKNQTKPGWQPIEKDLIANDWIVCG